MDSGRNANSETRRGRLNAGAGRKKGEQVAESVGQSEADQAAGSRVLIGISFLPAARCFAPANRS